MSEFKSVLKSLRTAKGLNQEELADQLKMSRSAIGMYETGKREPRHLEELECIADFFNVDVDFLLGRRQKTTYIPRNNQKGVQIPVYGKVAAGIPIEMIEDIVDTEEITQDMARTGNFFGLRIKGDSMEPRMKDDDVVIVRQQEEAENGDTVIATINGDEATCKKLHKTKDGIALVATNPNYEPMFFSKKEVAEKPVKIIGRVVELRAKF